MMEEYLIDNKGDILYTRIFRNNGKDTVIVLHGGPGVPNDMEPVTQALSQTHQVIIFHQRGTRKSVCRTRDYSIEAYLGDINAITQHFDIRQFHIFGHSWGGLYAQLYAQQYPDRVLSLFLSCSIGDAGQQYATASREIQKYNVSRINLATLFKLSLYTVFAKSGSDMAYREILKVILDNYNKGFTIDPKYKPNVENVKADAINRTRKEIVLYNGLKDVFENQYKVTVIYGAYDVFTDSKQYTLNRFPGADQYIIPDCGHNPWLHNATYFERILLQHYR